MGTQWKIILFHQDSLKGAQIIQTAFQQLDYLNTIFSDYDLDSELSRLSAQAGKKEWIPVSEELYKVLATSKQYAKRSKGIFDPTIGPLSKLWRRAFRRQEFPDWQAIKAAQSNVDYKSIRVKTPNLVNLKKDAMRLDVGGIAKGWSVDYLADFLIKQRIKSFLIDGGGDIRVGEAPPERPSWKISLPDGTTQGFRNQAIATSGAQYRFLEKDGKRYSHIIHPKTGLGIDGSETITVIANTCTSADVSATIISVMTPRERRSFFKKETTIHQLIIKKYEEKKLYQK